VCRRLAVLHSVPRNHHIDAHRPYTSKIAEAVAKIYKYNWKSDRMEITDVEAIPVRVPFTPLEGGGIGPYVANHAAYEEVDRVLVKVTTDEGLHGWGEIRVFLEPDVTVKIIEDGIAPLVVGQSPMEVEGLRRQVFIEYADVDHFFAPIEIACWDIRGKALGESVSTILGGTTARTPSERKWRTEVDAQRSESVEIAYCVGILSPAESARKAEQVADAGYDVLKTKAGRDWEEDVERIVAMDEATDGALEFRLDPNQGWTLDQAVRVATGLSREGVELQYLEQPITVNSHENLAKLRERTTQPIAPNEDTYIQNNLRRLIERGAMDAAVVDMTPAGGISGLRNLVAMAEDAGVPTAHHTAFDLGIKTAAVLHAVTGIPGFELPPDSVYPAWEDDVISEPFDVEDGELSVPQSPGLGIDVDLDAVERYRL
jgi:L-alanine-DL-glutamate epimerase-like enolase superfamily enzyme